MTNSIIFRTPDGAEDASQYPILFAALLESTEVEWTPDDLAKLASKNLIRVLKEVENFRDEMQDMKPFQDWIPASDYLESEKQCKS